MSEPTDERGGNRRRSVSVTKAESKAYSRDASDRMRKGAGALEKGDSLRTKAAKAEVGGSGLVAHMKQGLALWCELPQPLRRHRFFLLASRYNPATR